MDQPPPVDQSPSFDSAPASVPSSRRKRRGATRFDPAQASRAQRILLLAIRLLFLVILVTVSLLPFVGAVSDLTDEEGGGFGTYIVPLILTLAFGLVVVVLDVATPNKKLAQVFGIYLGIVAGLVGTVAIGVLLDLVAESWSLQPGTLQRAYFDLFKLAIGITLCYLAVSIVLTTKDDLRLVIPYVEFAKQVRGVRPLLLDTSVLIDGRIVGMCDTGVLDAPLVVPQFVIDELQQLSDSSDKLKRDRGRRGLGVVTKLQQNPRADVSIEPATSIVSGAGGRSVDHLLLRMAADQHTRVLTTDYNLNRVGEIQGVTVLNLNDIANALKSQVIPGEQFRLEIVKRGENPEQGVGYLDDGTMVVVQDGAPFVGKTIEVIVTNSLQTAAGKLFFARSANGVGGASGLNNTNDEIAKPQAAAGVDDGNDEGRVSRIADAATSQPRSTDRPHSRAGKSPRNPRR